MNKKNYTFRWVSLNNIKKAASVVLVLCVAESLHPQTKTIEISANVSPTVSMKLRNVNPNQYLMGLDAGLVIKYALTQNMNLNPGIIYSIKGFDNEKNINGNQFDYDYKSYIEYIELPVYLSYDLNDNSKLTPYFVLGSMLQFMVKYRYVDNINPEQSYSLSGAELSDNDFRKVNFGLISGFAIETFLSSKFKIGLEGLFKMSFLNFKTVQIHDYNSSKYHYSLGINLKCIYKLK